MSEAQKIKHHATTSIEDARALLEDIAAAIGDGRLSINAGDERVELMPHGNVDIDLKVSSKGDDESIRIEMSWCKPSAPLRIVTDEGEFRMGPPLPSDDLEGDDDDELGNGESEPKEHSEAHDDGSGGRGDSLGAAEMLAYLSRERLYEYAQKLDLHGRSSMDKAELVESLSEVMDEQDLTKTDRKEIAKARRERDEAPQDA